jgi:hypothetical protein
MEPNFSEFSWFITAAGWALTHAVELFWCIVALSAIILIAMNACNFIKFTNWFGLGSFSENKSPNSLVNVGKKLAKKADSFLSGDNPLDSTVELELKATLYKKPNGKLYAESAFYLPNGTKQSELDAYEQVSQDLFIANLPWNSLQRHEVLSAEIQTSIEIEKTDPETEKEISTLFPSNKNQNNNRRG